MRSKAVKYLLILLVLGMTVASVNAQSDTSKRLMHTVYLIGDVGDDTLLSAPTLNLLKSYLLREDQRKSSVVILGDNIYPEGLHKKSHKLREQDEQRLNIQLDAVKDFKGEIIFIPGNHDWKQGGKKGDNYVKRQEKYLENYLDKGNVFLPDDGCPGPIAIEVNKGLVLLIMDTQWWLHDHDKPKGEQDNCSVLSRDEFIVRFGDMLKKYRNRNILIAGHHPLYSNGNHGGKFSIKDHIFPITAASKNAYIPLPVLGSIYPLYRKLLGDRQDLANSVYKAMIRNMLLKMDEYENIVYASGHEHNLQYFYKKSNHHIISGSGSKSTFVRDNSKVKFASKKRGFSRLRYYTNGEVWMEFYSPDADSITKPIYQRLLYSKDVVLTDKFEKGKASYKGQFRTVIPDSGYEATAMKKLFFGSLNRELWTEPISVPVLDINFVKGGLSPIKQGGGMQTRSLRLQGGDGYQYVLRTIKKDATYLVGKNLRNTLAQDIILDGIAGSHPYAAIVVPQLADAVGVYHTNPKLVYVPKDSSLGDYLDDFGGTFCLFEERPDDDMSSIESFGRSKKVVNYSKTIEKVHGKYGHNVDYKYIIRARLFDMLIADWDRHDDQWRWATFKEGDKTIYRPIPRDRDQVFFKFDGLFPQITNRKWAMRKFQGFHPDVRDIRGQNFNARYFDRSWLTAANREDWMAVAESMKAQLTDEVIERAIKTFPAAAYQINGEFLIQTLKSRRDKLLEFADRYYQVLSREVDVVGKLKNDYFEVIRNENGDVEVNIYARKKGDKVEEKHYYHRLFKRNETSEIRLYGLGGEDEFHISGEVKKSILVRIIGGFDKDKYRDESNVKGIRKFTRIYDTRKTDKKHLKKSKETAVSLESEENAISYNRKVFKYDKTIPLPSFGFSPDDGLYVGAGFQFTKQGFNKFPNKYTHKFLANRSFKTSAFNVYYNYRYTRLFGKWDFGGNAIIEEPLVYNYYRPGNESVDSLGKNNSTIRKEKYQFRPFIERRSNNGLHGFLIGADIQRISFEHTNTLDVLLGGTPENKSFTAVFAEYSLENKDNGVNPVRGVAFMAGIERAKGVSDDDINFTKIKSKLTIYFPLNFMPIKTTLAMRSGFARNFGEYEFYQANFIGGYKQLRGVRRNRFSGKTSFYNNIDLRFNLVRIKNYVLPFELGLLAHYDVGRVWEEGEDSDVWHESMGGGVFFNILDFVVLNATYSKSEIDEFLVIGTNFLF
jgi:hypothetical protein